MHLLKAEEKRVLVKWAPYKSINIINRKTIEIEFTASASFDGGTVYGRKCQNLNFTWDIKNCLTQTQLILNKKFKKCFEIFLGFIESSNAHPERSIHFRENICQRNGASPKTLILIHEHRKRFGWIKKMLVASSTKFTYYVEIKMFSWSNNIFFLFNQIVWLF